MPVLLLTLMVHFDTPLHAGLSVLMIALWVWAIADVILSPRRDWYNRRGKVVTALLVALPTVYFDAIFIPIGSLVWFAWWRNAGGMGHLPKQRRPGSPNAPEPHS